MTRYGQIWRDTSQDTAKKKNPPKRLILKSQKNVCDLSEYFTKFYTLTVGKEHRELFGIATNLSLKRSGPSHTEHTHILRSAHAAALGARPCRRPDA